MNLLTMEWIEKAEGDFITARRELGARRYPNYDAACFHSQQVAEKYLKAVLQEQNSNVPRTHHLIDLLALCLQVDKAFNTLRSDLILLNGYSVTFRYPGRSATKEDAKRAVKSATTIRAFTRAWLNM